MRPSVAVLGAGTLGEIVIGALISAGWPMTSVRALVRREERAEELRRRHGIVASTEPGDVISDRQVLVVGVKPKDVDAILSQVRDRVGRGHVVLSLCAGVRTQRFEDVLGDVPVVRSMPNTPASVGAGMTGYARGSHATDADVALCHQILVSLGEAVEVGEPALDAVTAVSGSGPAYVFLLAEAMEQAALELGLSAATATLLVQQTIAGAAALLAASPLDAAALRTAVTSPGGTTAAALDVLDSGGFTDLVVAALTAAAQRSVELGGG